MGSVLIIACPLYYYHYAIIYFCHVIVCMSLHGDDGKNFVKYKNDGDDDNDYDYDYDYYGDIMMLGIPC